MGGKLVVSIDLILLLLVEYSIYNIVRRPHVDPD
jgi:hypothetical protein